MINRTRSFYIYPEKGNKYWRYRVFVTPSQRCLERYAEQARIQDPTNTGAFCQTWRVRRFKRGGPKNGTSCGDLGSLCFNADNMFLEFISHECCHAAHGYCRRKRKTNYSTRTNTSSVHHDEEVYCYAQGWMTQQIVDWCIRNGFEFGKKE